MFAVMSYLGLWNMFLTIYNDGWQQMAFYKREENVPWYLQLWGLCETATASKQSTDKKYSDYPSEINALHLSGIESSKHH